MAGTLSVSAGAGRQTESDLDSIRRQQQRMQLYPSLLSNIVSVPYLPSHDYLRALLQQSQNESSTSHSTRNEILSSMLRAEFYRSRNISRSLPTLGMHHQNIGEPHLTLWLNRQNQNEDVVGSITPNYSTLGLPNTPALNSLRSLQQYTDAISARREQQMNELQRQILLDPSAAS